MIKKSLVPAIVLSLFCPVAAIAENESEMHGGLISLLYPSQYHAAERLTIEWMALDTQPLLANLTVPRPPCNRTWQRGQEVTQCDEVFVPLRSADSGAFVESPRFLSSLRSFSYGTDSKKAFGMDVPDLMVSLRGQFRGTNSDLTDRDAFGNARTR